MVLSTNEPDSAEDRLYTSPSTSSGLPTVTLTLSTSSWPDDSLRNRSFTFHRDMSADIENEFDHVNNTSDQAGDTDGGASRESLTASASKKKPGPIQHKWNWFPVIMLLCYIGAGGYYFYVRCTNLINAYTIFVLAVELLGVTSFLPYAVLLVRGVYPTGSTGLPKAEDNCCEEASKFHVRVLIPCYKESLSVIAGTVSAAFNAALPANTLRTVYLLDDGRDPQKQAYIASLGPGAVYVTGRERKKGEVNGKSSNLNNALCKVIYKDYMDSQGNTRWADIPISEVVVVFDADMNAKPEFFCKILEVMVDDNISLCLTPQGFHNIDPEADLFNNINILFWEYWLPGAFGWGYISCTGTNFCIRTRSLAHCGWFPTYTVTEDYALGMELKKNGYRGTYLMEYLAVGEAPEEVRNVFRQRSRWTKGHVQVFCSERCPLFAFDLPFFQRFWYTYSFWAPLCTVITIPVFFLVPFISIVFGLHPVLISFDLILATTLYFAALMMIQNYVRSWAHFKMMWFVTISNVVLWFTYLKAFINTWLALMGFKTIAFKVTDKTKPQADAPPPAGLVDAVKQTVRRMSSMLTPHASDRLLAGSPFSSNLDPALMRTPKSAKASRSRVHSTNDDITEPLDPQLDSPRHYANPPSTPADGHHAYTSSSSPLHSPQHLRLRVKPATPKALYKVQSLSPRSQEDSESMHSLAAEANTKLLALKHMESMSQPDTRAYRDAMKPMKAPAPALTPKVAPSLIAPSSTGLTTMSTTQRIAKVFASFKPRNLAEAAEVLDPLALVVLFCLCALTLAMGIWQLAREGPTSGSPALYTFEFNSPINTSPYVLISMMWASYNLIAPYLFIHYCFTDGPSFKWVSTWLMRVSMLLVVTSLVLVWLMIPISNNPVTTIDASLGASGFYTAQVVVDNNTNYEFVVGLQAVPVTLSEVLGVDSVPTVNLSGGLFPGSDHVKYAMPLAYSLTMLAWGYLEFGSGFSNSQEQLFSTLRTGADYLVACHLTVDPSHPVFVAQVGDPLDYLIPINPDVDPAANGSIWTHPSTDPFLNGNETRKVWLMTKDYLGADLLSSVSAALASVAAVMQESDPEYADSLLLHAEQIFAFARLYDGQPSTYCQFVPCTANVTNVTNILLKPVAPVTEPICWVSNFALLTCLPVWDINSCIEQRQQSADVFSTQNDCCSTMYSNKVWATTDVKEQGVCAVPEGQFYCYIPDQSLRTCRMELIDNVTGIGCSGYGLEVFADTVACCAYLTTNGIINAGEDSVGTGVCSYAELNPTEVSTCYIANLVNATCEEANGTYCSSFGLDTSFTNSLACCNYVVEALAGLKVAKRTTGLCKAMASPPTALTNQNNHRRFLSSFPMLTSSGNVSQAIVPSSYSMSSMSSFFQGTTAGAAGNVALRSTSSRALRQTASTPSSSTFSSLLSLLEGSGSSNAAALPPPPPSNGVLPWDIPTLEDVLVCNTTIDKCSYIDVETQVEVTFFNSTSILDDMAWAAVWLYKATSNTRYLGASQKYMRRHYLEDITPHELETSKLYYGPSWNNVAWATNVLLARITGDVYYQNQLLPFFKTWLYGDPPVESTVGSNIDAKPTQTILELPTLAVGNDSYYVIPTCKATSTYENMCFNNYDDDCNGETDKDDLACGLFPVRYTTKGLAYMYKGPSLPHVADASFLALAYAPVLDSSDARSLRCWSLQQISYIQGGGQEGVSYVVGFGPSSPQQVQHRASSCPLTDGELCTWENGFYPGLPNPRLDTIQGAMVNGPDRNDNFLRPRPNNDTIVTLHANAPFTGSLAGLQSTGTTIRSCALYHGVYQKYITGYGQL